MRDATAIATRLADDWVKRALGLDVARAIATAQATGSHAAVWQAALATVERQLAGLATHLSRRTDAASHNVAMVLLPMLAELGKPVTDALRELDRAAPGSATRAESVALDRIATGLLEIKLDRRIAAVDNNPFGVPVSMAASLTEALRRVSAGIAPG